MKWTAQTSIPTFLGVQHADLGAEEVQNTLSTLAARLRAGGEEARSSSDGDVPEAEPAVLRDRVREAIEGREPLDAPAPSQSQKGDSSKGEPPKGELPPGGMRCASAHTQGSAAVRL